MTYLLTAIIDLKYRLREPPAKKEGYTIKAGKSIRITKDALSFLHMIDVASGRRATLADYVLTQA